MLRLSTRELNRLTGKKPPKDAPLTRNAPETREKPLPRENDTHRLKASLQGKFDNPPLKGSCARCTRCGSQWLIQADSGGVGDTVFTLTMEEFPIFYEEIEK